MEDIMNADKQSRLYGNGIWRLCIVVTLVLGVQVLGGYATASSVKSWYPLLVKAPWNPPGWVFGPVWSLLYILMAWSGWRVWQQLARTGVEQPWQHPALQWFLAQLLFNLSWSVLFFGLRSPFLALVLMLWLWVSIAQMIRHFLRVDRTAGYSQVPYLLWVSFAFTLNAAIVYLNGMGPIH
jgi:benzodiazapine receptor